MNCKIIAFCIYVDFTVSQLLLLGLYYRHLWKKQNKNVSWCFPCYKVMNLETTASTQLSRRKPNDESENYVWILLKSTTEGMSVWIPVSQQRDSRWIMSRVFHLVRSQSRTILFCYHIMYLAKTHSLCLLTHYALAAILFWYLQPSWVL